MKPVVMGVMAPLRSGRAPQMRPDTVDSVLEAKLPEIEIKGDAESL